MHKEKQAIKDLLDLESSFEDNSIKNINSMFNLTQQFEDN